MKRLLLFLLISFFVGAIDCTAQMNFEVNPTGNQDADGAFRRATQAWQSEFSDDMTVFVEYSFASLDEGVLSSNISGTDRYSYTEFWSAIGDDATTSDDASMFAALPTGTSFSVYINKTTEAGGSSFEIPYVDDDGGRNNTNVRITSANAKSLGLKNPHATVSDGVVIFNDAFDWDFDSSDGISEGHLDFEGVAIHELGHTLGFESGIDILDISGDGTASDDDFGFVSSIDFLRFSDDSELAGADIDWTADSRAKYFSINGGLTSGAAGNSHWSLGLLNGDGEQASHWKDGLNLGAMDPTTGFEMINPISGLELVAFDVIGYDRNSIVSVPEPAGLAVVMLAGGMLLRRRKRR